MRETRRWALVGQRRTVGWEVRNPRQADGPRTASHDSNPSANINLNFFRCRLPEQVWRQFPGLGILLLLQVDAGKRFGAEGTRIVRRGSRFVRRGSRFVRRGSRFVRRGSRFVRRGSPDPDAIGRETCGSRCAGSGDPRTAWTRPAHSLDKTRAQLSRTQIRPRPQRGFPTRPAVPGVRGRETRAQLGQDPRTAWTRPAHSLAGPRYDPAHNEDFPQPRSLTNTFMP
jgi:hypothetical protein